MSGPVLFPIPTKYWTPYQKFSAFRWYNSTKYEWVHIRIDITPEGYWPHYEYLTNKSKYIMQLTPQLLIQYILQVLLQRLNQKENLIMT